MIYAISDLHGCYDKYIKTRENILNAGVDRNGFSPVSFDEIISNNKKYKGNQKQPLSTQDRVCYNIIVL